VTDALLLPPVPVPDADSAAYWESLRQGTLGVCRCTVCRTRMHPPLEACRSCGAPTAIEPVSGSGTVFSFIVVRHQTIPGHAPPYVVAVIELDEQPGLRMTGVIDADPEAVAVGLPVRARIDEIGDTGFAAPTFELTG
jgi:uncharacterized OB-fold protein